MSVYSVWPSIVHSFSSSFYYFSLLLPCSTYIDWLTDQLGRPVEHLYVTGLLAVVRDSKSARRPLLCLWSLATATFWRHTHISGFSRKPMSPTTCKTDERIYTDLLQFCVGQFTVRRGLTQRGLASFYRIKTFKAWPMRHAAYSASYHYKHTVIRFHCCVNAYLSTMKFVGKQWTLCDRACTTSLVLWNLSHGTVFYTVVTALPLGAMYYSVCNVINVLLMTFYH